MRGLWMVDAVRYEPAEQNAVQLLLLYPLLTAWAWLVLLSLYSLMFLAAYVLSRLNTGADRRK